jgi:hypothetical protein
VKTFCQTDFVDLLVKRWSGNLALIIVAILVGILLFEIGLRLAGISYPSFYTWDEYRGFALRPGAEGWYRTEGEAYLRINSVGLRDREHTKIKPANTLRLAILGDSYAEARQVSIEQTFWAVLERELEKCSYINGRHVEVINFGVSGYGTAQELMTLRYKVWDYSPDVVLLAFLTGNDVTENLRAFGSDPMRPYFVYRNGELVLDDSFRNLSAYRARQTLVAGVGYWAINYSRVIQVINAAQHKIKSDIRNRAHGELEPRGKDKDDEEAGLDDRVYSEPSDPLWQEAWRVTEGLIVLMRDEVKEHGADFSVVTLSNAMQVYPDPSVRQAFMERLGVRTLFYPDLRIKTVGEREGFSVLNLAPKFQLYADQYKIFLHGFHPTIGRGHWNANGHRLAGETIAHNLCEDIAAKERMAS